MPEVRSDEALELRALTEGDNCKRLQAGMDFIPLAMFLKKNSLLHQQREVSKTYVFVTPTGKVVGYITLLCAQIQLVSALDGVDDYPGNDYPAVKIAKLAVDRDYRGFDLGSKLVDLSLAIANEQIRPRVGCRFLIVDSHQLAIDFYKKRGFRLLDTAANLERAAPLMFIDLMRV